MSVNVGMPEYREDCETGIVEHCLTERQKRFVDLFIRTGSAIKSALEAGYRQRLHASLQ
ncbi:MAG: terminase small subunit [Chitinispirillales bacterium]|nr:terminase small subunit [Chitinispirillales bacterium]